MLNYNDTNWQFILDLHQNEFPFKLRPFTTNTIIYLKNNFALSIKTAFIIHQYFLLAVFIGSFGFYLNILGFAKK